MSVAYESPKTYRSPTAPTALAGALVTPVPVVDDLWVDQINHLVKRCISAYPFVWVSIEGGGSSPNFSDVETPTGAIDSVNTTYTLANPPSPAGSLHIWHNGLLLRPTTDYSIAGGTITTTFAPQTGDNLRASYRY